MNATPASAVALDMRSKLSLVLVSAVTLTLVFGSVAAVADPVEEGSSTTAPALGLSKPATAAPVGNSGTVAAGPEANVTPASSAASNATPVGSVAGDPTVTTTLPGATTGPPTTAYDLGKAALEGSDYATAVAQFRAAIAADPKNADAHNFLAFSSRKNGDLKTAFAEYKVALKLNPKHRGAHEYLGEYYVQVGKTALAKAELAKLKTICGVGCEQYLDLAATIGSAKRKRK